MALRLNGSSSGYVELDVPADAGSHTLTLPDGGGSSGQYLQTNGSGALSWQTVPNNGFESYAVIADQKTNSTNSGSFTSGAWRTRDLNTELLDPDGIVTISSNQFTLQAGSYLIRWHTPAYQVDSHRSGLYDVTGTAFIEYSINAYANSANNVGNVASGFGRVTITAANTYEIRHQAYTTSNNVGFGAGSVGYGDAEIFTVVEIYKEA
jgi:hypothetical protein